MVHTIRTIDAHAAGEPLRLIVDGLPSPEGESMLEKRAWAIKRLDHLRRALMLEPRILLLDEPSLGLAPLVVSRIFDVIRGLRDRGTTVLLVEQNANMALRLADRAYVLETGAITCEGTGKGLLEDARIREAYLGD